jgi:hypothetical protein
MTSFLSARSRAGLAFHILISRDLVEPVENGPFQVEQASLKTDIPTDVMMR